MIKFTDCKAIDCGVGYVFGHGVEAELIRSNAETCKIGFLQIGNEEEYSLLLEKMLLHPDAVKQLAESYQSAKPDSKDEAIRKSQLFEYLSAFANAATVYSFIEGVIKSLLKIP